MTQTNGSPGFPGRFKNWMETVFLHTIDADRFPELDLKEKTEPAELDEDESAEPDEGKLDDDSKPK